MLTTILSGAWAWPNPINTTPALYHSTQIPTVRLFFTTFASSNLPATFTGDVTNIRIYKNGNTTQRTSTAGIILHKDFTKVGTHLLTIDLSDNTVAGFYAAGSTYAAMLEEIIIDSLSASMVVCDFAIE